MISNAVQEPRQLELPLLSVWTPDEKVAYIDGARSRVEMDAMQLMAFADECRKVANMMLRHAPRPTPGVV